MNDDAQVAADPDRPDVLVPGLVEIVENHKKTIGQVSF